MIVIEKIPSVSILSQREYIKAENEAYEYLISKGYCPQGASPDFKTVHVMKFEHPEFKDNPVKCGKREMLSFRNWQEAKERLCLF